ncbi:NAD(P)-specific glutamate dehydrogenase [Planctomycetes bacterium Pla163]|uniref:Glutamate dehydrogenase n=1 Tax=Rohdeia mirabilis TaxID=2528008 RepID=A0A518CY57_9BACT|nr:NAD(P)-specific glutamate dehydrogenase [Planctomycetes bacterium Pla163]
MDLSNYDSTEAFMAYVRQRNSSEPEFLQAVEEVVDSLLPFVREHKRYTDQRILERLVEPDRAFQFRVTWEDDNGDVQVNRGYRVQFNNAIGPYKGGLRFHPSVNLSVLKFLGFEQIFKNSLTGLPMGGGKGGSDFDPKGRSDREVMRFCQSFMNELFRHVGTYTDVPAGDIGVGAREIGYLFGQHKRLTNTYTGVLTGKGLNYGGSVVRTEATGYGAVYFAKEMMELRGDGLDGKRCIVSGSGNVALYAAQKLMQEGAKVVTLSDSKGFIHDPEGLDAEKWEFVRELKEERRGRISEYAEKFKGTTFHEGAKPWGVEANCAFPCATQNEISNEDAALLVKNGIDVVSEGANMPTANDGVKRFVDAGILYGPGKAANAGGVAVSGLEQSQNAQRLSWSRMEVDDRLRGIMADIHKKCVVYGSSPDGSVNYVRGSNIAGFVKIAEAQVAYGLV